MPIEVKLTRIVINELGGAQAIYLKEVGGRRGLPIAIGIFEATSISRRVQGIATPRPLTHDLVVQTIEQLGGDVQDIVITEIKKETFYAVIRIRCSGGLIEVDARPSDAIAVAVTPRPALPIFVIEDVLDVVNDSD